ncbi:MAG: lysophospholipase L1-like esterase [Pseudoalteromonas tetraodonis]|jgi:lysophospholipase L1-like esterase
MNYFSIFRPAAICAASFLALCPPQTGAVELLLKKGDRLAVVGDSITEQKQYSRFIEDYLLACTPELDLHIFQFGWSGERAPGFANRMDNDLVPWKPDVVTTAFGMNDGSYQPFNDAIGKNYADGTRRIQDRMKEIGARMVVGGPGPVDLDSWRRGEPDADKFYNENLGKLSSIAGGLAKERGFVFANMHPLMMEVMAKAKAANGDAYHVCGGDGVHPGANGHLVMAYTFLKALGVDGNIGTISVDMNAGATATDGHKIISAKAGQVEVESSRYPFCFFGGEKDPNGTRSILPFLPFNEDLNRYLLVVKNLTAENADVTWGNATKTFSKAQLENGVNLPAEFIDNPFSEPFQKLDRSVAAKQQFETQMIKGIVTNFRSMRQALNDDAELDGLLEQLYGKLAAKQEKLQAEARAMVQPVKHQLTIKAN